MRVLVVQDRTIDQISPALTVSGYQVIGVAQPQDDLVRRTQSHPPDVIVLDIVSPDARLLDQLSTVGTVRPCPVVMFTSAADAGAIRKALAAGVTAYIVDGLHVKRLKAVLDVAIIRFAELQRLRSELAYTKQSLADRKTVDRAKGILMQRRGMTEDVAYSTLRKLAMDRNQRIGDVAQSVISAAELIG